MPRRILPSILSADMTRLGEEIEKLEAAGIQAIHFDVMDGCYVPNITLGPFVCEALKKRFPKLEIDVHLMVSSVDEAIKAFASAGASRIAIHPETPFHLDRSLNLIKSLNVKCGLALNPATPLETLTWVEELLDFILLMTVNPGYAGQTFIPRMLEKIAILHQRYPLIPIAVDGGIQESNIASVAKAGASDFVMGSAFFGKAAYSETLKRLQKQLNFL